MKIYEISIFLIALNLALAMFSGFGLVDSQIMTVSIDDEMFTETVPDQDEYRYTDIEFTMFGDFIRAFFMMIIVVAQSLVIFPILLSNLPGIPSMVTLPLQILISVVYMVGLAQIIGKINIAVKE